METSIRLDKSQILERLNGERRRMYDVLAQLTPEERAQPKTIGEWSVKDVVAHMIFWNRFPVRELEHALRGEDPAKAADPRHEDEINAESVARYCEAGYDEVVSEFERTYRTLIATIEALPNRAFAPDGDIECLLGDTVAGTLDNNTYEHWALHRSQIEERFNVH
jgi:uncharacterized protein (TIGR03083 family)